jgi:hypothetical protein
MSSTPQRTLYKHPQVLTETPFCGPVCVDTGLVSTLEMIWAEGYETDNSCENNGGQIWISFDQQSFERLVQRAHDSYKGALTYSENLGEFLETSCRTTPTWSDDGHVNAEDDWVSGDTIYFYMSVRFDRILLDTFTRLFKLSHAQPDNIDQNYI